MYGTANSVHTLIWSVRRWLGQSPMQKVMEELERRRSPLGEIDGLEVFGGDGTRHTIDYAARLRSLEVWEVDPDRQAELQKNLPNALIRNVDSYVEVNKTKRTYDLVVLDNAVSLFGPDLCFCEHFEIFTPILAILRSPGVIILNVLPEVKDDPDQEFHSRVTQLARRRHFYGEVNSSCIELKRMIESYREKLWSQGWELEWEFSRQRTVRSKVHYLIMKVTRTA